MPATKKHPISQWAAFRFRRQNGETGFILSKDDALQQESGVPKWRAPFKEGLMAA
ncbi:hypothetical protein DESC_720137 [Desulfosarcina cetonica]|nr:hypothetical protein DESC_720137 [Desulfosarcina cetonica]